jgi:hypothetical protein
MVRLVASFLFLILPIFVFGQSRITGRILDGETGDPLPYVTVMFVGTTTGTTSDFDGQYSLTSEIYADSIKVLYIGYAGETKPFVFGVNQEINFTLFPAAGMLGETVIKPGVNPALRIIKLAQQNRKKYNINKLESYEYESYNKVQLAVDNISEKFKKRKIFDAMEPLFDTISSFQSDSSLPVLPVFVSESLSDFYYLKTPRRTSEVIKGSKINGVGVGDDSYISQMLGSTFQQYNFNDNNLYILDKDFISPISITALSYYIYDLVDSVYLDNIKCYQINVYPKNPKDLVFKGTIWITDTTFALKQLALEITKDANINFIEKLKIQQEITEVAPNAWVPSKLRVLIDIAEITDNTLGLIGLYYNSNENIRVNTNRKIKFYDTKLVILEDAHKHSAQFWDTARHEKISQADIHIYKMVDSLKSQPIVKTYVDVLEVVVEGFYNFGKVEVGPYYYLLGWNLLEGARSRLTLRTTEDFSKKWRFRGYGAYGVSDKQWKYLGSAEYIFNRDKWFKLGVMYKKDVEQIGVTDQDYGTTALFDAISILGSTRINRAELGKVWIEKEIMKGYIQKVEITSKEFLFEPVGDYNFSYKTNPELGTSSDLASNYHLTTINVEARISHKELYIIRKNQRITIANLKAPVVKIGFTQSLTNFGSDFNFQQIKLDVWQFNSLGNYGTFEYNIYAGKTFGTVPYPSLFVMRGNESYASNMRTYNLMNFFEFVADQYVSAHYEHQFNGLLMNRVPLFNKLKWRSFANAKMIYGQMSEENQKLIPNFDEDGRTVTPIGTFETGKPYVEIGYGIENIFKVLRFDFIHRLTYLDRANISPFGLKGTFVFRF